MTHSYPRGDRLYYIQSDGTKMFQQNADYHQVFFDHNCHWRLGEMTRRGSHWWIQTDGRRERLACCDLRESLDELIDWGNRAESERAKELWQFVRSALPRRSLQRSVYPTRFAIRG